MGCHAMILAELTDEVVDGREAQLLGNLGHIVVGVDEQMPGLPHSNGNVNLPRTHMKMATEKLRQQTGADAALGRQRLDGQRLMVALRQDGQGVPQRQGIALAAFGRTLLMPQS